MCPVEVRNPRISHDMVMADRRLKVREIAKVLGISNDKVNNILNEHLGMEKKCLRCVLCFLTIDEKYQQVNFSKDELEKLQ